MCNAILLSKIYHGLRVKNNISRVFYHVTSGGNYRKFLFKIKRDREKFLEKHCARHYQMKCK